MKFLNSNNRIIKIQNSSMVYQHTIHSSWDKGISLQIRRKSEVKYNKMIETTEKEKKKRISVGEQWEFLVLYIWSPRKRKEKKKKKTDSVYREFS